ncbi:DUF4377 domain-containing protein [Alteromonas antoniana]|uniref:DUF4377 domain-containing protein n=1 Tax=Alteromonas antoniana TaxID=2803813 RepID=UPI001C4632A4|nr:DUF4377 domain-containing protein [Alteromonas antoniana]
MFRQSGSLLLAAMLLNACSSDDESSEVRQLSIQSHKVVCEAVSQQLCLSASGQNDLTAFFPFYEDIRDFQFQWGHQYSLTVEVSRVENPPADGSDREYTLLSVDSESVDTAGTLYFYSDVELLQNTFTKDGTDYTFLGQPFSCLQAVECDSLVSMSGSGGILDELVFRYLGEGKIQLERWL